MRPRSALATIVTLLAMFAPVSLAVGQQDYPPQPDQQYQQPASPQQQPDPYQGGYQQPAGPQQQPDPYQGGYQQPDPSQSYPPPQDQSQGVYQPPPPDASQGGTQQAPSDAQQGGDQADHDSAGGYSLDSAGQDKPGHTSMPPGWRRPSFNWEGCRGLPHYPDKAQNEYNEWPVGPNSIVIKQQVYDAPEKVRAWFAKALPGWKFVDYDMQHYFPASWQFTDGRRQINIYWRQGPYIDVNFVCSR